MNIDIIGLPEHHMSGTQQLVKSKRMIAKEYIYTYKTITHNLREYFTFIPNLYLSRRKLFGSKWGAWCRKKGRDKDMCRIR